MGTARKLVATIDCGSSNVRCIIFDMESGTQVSVSAADWYVPQNGEIEGAYDFNDRINWKLVCQCTRAALAKVRAEEIAAVTATGFRHGIFLLDRKQDEIVYGCFNMDSRMDSTYIHEHGLEKTIFEQTGDWPTLHGLPRLMWLKANKPEQFDRVTDAMLVSDWVAYKLSGEIAVEPGDASSTLLLDVRQRKWSADIASACGIPMDILPKVVDAGTVIGSVTAAAAEETGFLKGTPVVCGVADTQAGLVGVGAVGLDTSAIVGGTYWLVCHSTGTPVVDPEYRTRLSCHSEKGQWIYEGIGYFHGLIVRWFRDAFGAEEKEIAKRYGLSPYTLLDALTRDVPAGSYGLQVLMSDIANQSCWRHAGPTFTGWNILDPTKSHKGVFFKALLENACYVAYGEYENIRRILASDTIPRSVLLSGGAAHSPVWCQILSDVLDRPVYTPREREGTALGGAIYASIGMGLYKDTAEAVKAVVKPDLVFEPNWENHEVYMQEYARWRELYKNGLELVGRGLVKSMWQPASTLTETQRQNPWHLY